MFRTICCLILMTGVAGANEMEFTMENSHIKIVDGKPHKLTITNNFETRADVRIFRRTFINKECKLVGLPIYNILRPAIHGIVCYRDEHSPLRIATGKERCIGVDVMLRVVYFEPNKNYVGGDSFQFTIS